MELDEGRAFIGRDVLEKQKAAGDHRVMVGLVMDDKGVRGPLLTVSSRDEVGRALELMREHGVSQIPVVSAEVRIDEGEVLLSAEFDFALTPALEQALEKGIPLYFTIEVEISRSRPLWFPEKIAEWSITYRVSYSSLTRQYRVASGPFGQTFESLEDVQRFIGHVASAACRRCSASCRAASRVPCSTCCSRCRRRAG